jgi:hypothetical protein
MTLHTIAGLSITLVIVLVFYVPAIWGIEDKLSFLSLWQAHIKHITLDGHKPFNIISFGQVFFRTPLLVLFLAFAGIIEVIRQYRKNMLYSLLLIWMLVPVIIPCLPNTATYSNGMRLYLMFLVPWTLMAMIGLFKVVNFLTEKMQLNGKGLAGGIATFTIGMNLLGIILTHPYQTTFFNALAGGLSGAQEKKIEDACDYWRTSFNEAGRWITTYGEKNANVVAFGNFYLINLRIVIDREDIKVFRLLNLPVRNGEIILPPNTYVIFIPQDDIRSQRSFLEQSVRFEKVYTISRQGGEICTIFYKPPGPL